MNPSIKIIKNKPGDETNESQTRNTKKTAASSTRETVNIVKSWIDDLRKKQLAQRRMLLQLGRLVESPKRQP